MRFWRSVPGALVVVALVGAAVLLGVVGLQVHRVAHPPRAADASESLGVELAQTTEVAFKATDGVPLTGWVLNGQAGRPAILLAHDLGGSKNALINLAIVLNKAGFTVLAFDFRGHGSSGGEGSTLGIHEARDVIGAADFLQGLSHSGVDTHRIGAYGTGMGAHAVVLAAAERSSLRVLVLDGLWPDAGWILVRRTYEDWPFGVKHLGGIPSVVFSVLEGATIADHRAADVLPALAGRDVLLVAAAGDGKLEEAMKGMYQSLPEARDSERSLVTLPTTESSGLSGDDLARYHQRIVEFFSTRLARP